MHSATPLVSAVSSKHTNKLSSSLYCLPFHYQQKAVSYCLLMWNYSVLSACIAMPPVPPQSHPLMYSFPPTPIIGLSTDHPMNSWWLPTHLKLLWPRVLLQLHLQQFPCLTPGQAPSLCYPHFPEQVFDNPTCRNGLLKLFPVSSALTPSYIIRK